MKLRRLSIQRHDFVRSSLSPSIQIRLQTFAAKSVLFQQVTVRVGHGSIFADQIRSNPWMDPLYVQLWLQYDIALRAFLTVFFDLIVRLKFPSLLLLPLLLLSLYPM